MVLAAGAQAQELAGEEAEREALASDPAGEGLVAEVSAVLVEVAGPVAEVAPAARLMRAVSGTQAKAAAAALVRAAGERAAVAV